MIDELCAEWRRFAAHEKTIPLILMILMLPVIVTIFRHRRITRIHFFFLSLFMLILVGGDVGDGDVRGGGGDGVGEEAERKFYHRQDSEL